jgi:hypothetical protein
MWLVEKCAMLSRKGLNGLFSTLRQGGCTSRQCLAKISGRPFVNFCEKENLFQLSLLKSTYLSLIYLKYLLEFYRSHRIGTRGGVVG